MVLADKKNLRQAQMRVRKEQERRTAERQRLNVFRSLSHIPEKNKDNEKGITLKAASSVEKGFEGNGSNTAGAELVDDTTAEKVLDKIITAAGFLRGSYFYYPGAIRVLRTAARP